MCNFCDKGKIIFSKLGPHPYQDHILTVSVYPNDESIEVISGHKHKEWTWYGYNIKMLYCPKCGRKLIKE